MNNLIVAKTFPRWADNEYFNGQKDKFENLMSVLEITPTIHYGEDLSTAYYEVEKNQWYNAICLLDAPDEDIYLASGEMGYSPKECKEIFKSIYEEADADGDYMLLYFG